LGDDIYVYTPKNTVIQLPLGSTPIDFAFHIHTDVGYQCRGALVDGHWVPLNRPLRTGERVEILTMQDSGPRFEWLRPELGYVTTPMAKSKIRRWFRRRPDEEKIALGRRQLHHVIERLVLQVDDVMALARRQGYSAEEELYRDIGGCDVDLDRVAAELIEIYAPSQVPEVCHNGPDGQSLINVGSLDKSFATCCRPRPGDDIVGYIGERDHNVQVHRSDCSVFLGQMVQDKKRFVEVRWGSACDTYLACLEIFAYDRPFLLRDVWDIISEEQINVADVKVHVNRAQDAVITICIDVENWHQLDWVLSRIEDLPGTIRVRRGEPAAA
jgi:GTP pyrophosphokinase